MATVCHLFRRFGVGDAAEGEGDLGAVVNGVQGVLAHAVVQAQRDDARHVLDGYLCAALEGHQGPRRSVHHHVPPDAVHVQQRADLRAPTGRINAPCSRGLPQGTM